MVAIDAEPEVRVEPLTEADVQDGLALSAEAGWNQDAADWTMLLRVGCGFGIRAEGRVVASALALPYPPLFGWLGMVLVHGPYRRHGLAKRLLAAARSLLESRGLVPMLDATPAGREVYRRVGFREVEPLSRWCGPGSGNMAVTSRSAVGLSAVRCLDERAFGADRTAILADIMSRRSAFALAKPGGAFVLSRPGRTATQIGPLVADRHAEGASLLEQALDMVAGPVVIDVPDREAPLAAMLARRGFVQQRSFVRMAVGRAHGFGKPELVRAIAGPELG